MRFTILLCLAAVSFTGCASLNDYHYRWVHGFRADTAWRKQHSLLRRWECSSHYTKGWKAGYFDVSTGGSGEPPAVPPPAYWSTVYQSESGQVAINDWFSGFQDGATAAHSAGQHAWHAIPTGPTIPTEFDSLPADSFDPFSVPNAQVQEDSFQPLIAPPVASENVYSWPPVQLDLGQSHVATSAVPGPTEPSQILPTAPVDVDSVPPVMTEE